MTSKVKSNGSPIPNPNPLGGYQTPPFKPVPSSSSSSSASSTPISDRQPPLPFAPAGSSMKQWVSPLHVDCHFPLSVFLSTMKGLALHPERNTTFILRADRLPSTSTTAKPAATGTGDHSSSAKDESVPGLDLVEDIKLRLLPRQPRRDGKLDQVCLFYRSKEDGHGHGLSDHPGHARVDNIKGKAREHGSVYRGDGAVAPGPGPGLKWGLDKGLVVMIPLVSTRSEIPYYHPPVRKIAFYYQSIIHDNPSTSSSSPDDEEDGQVDGEASEGIKGKEGSAALDEDSEVNEGVSETIKGRISIHYLPFDDDDDNNGPGSDSGSGELPEQLQRTSLAGGSALGMRRTSVGNIPKRSSPLAGPSVNLGSSGPSKHEPKASAAPPLQTETSEQPSLLQPVLPAASHSPRARTKPSPSMAGMSSLSFLPKHLSTPHSILSSDESDAEPNEQANDTSPIPKNTGKPPAPVSEDRLYRTCLGLLERVYKHGYGQLVGYQKRRVHDVIVPRDNFQDLYLVLKERHKHLDSRTSKPGMINTKLEDVKRHVWKNTSLPIVSTDDPSLPSSSSGMDVSVWGQQDVAIAAFLMLLWKDMYPARARAPLPADGYSIIDELDEKREWDAWGRPEGGFIDLGCGNGLLVHILISEGYNGKGYELRSRRTWPSYPAKTQESLVELPIDPPSWFPDTIDEWKSETWSSKGDCVIKENTFMIGNHSDELTPWLPLLSLIPSEPVPHLSLPCCLHNLDSAFDVLQYTAPDHPHTLEGGFENGLEPGVSRYKSYLMWLGYCGLKAGWQWEKEGLRVPSTKGWGIIARKRWTKGKEDDRECRIWALEQVNQVKARGAFKVREKEGKEH
ncbi:hypothetical protein IAU59_002874 [Kwoniella sp. CBS 9459]